MYDPVFALKPEDIVRSQKISVRFNISKTPSKTPRQTSCGAAGSRSSRKHLAAVGAAAEAHQVAAEQEDQAAESC